VRGVAGRVEDSLIGRDDIPDGDRGSIIERVIAREREPVPSRTGPLPCRERGLWLTMLVEAYKPLVKQVVDAFGCCVGCLSGIEIERQLLDAEPDSFRLLPGAPGQLHGKEQQQDDASHHVP
jgi:hypothetical protein